MDLWQKSNLRRCVQFPARFVLASNDTKVLLLICIAALFWSGTKHTHVPCHRLCFHQEHFHSRSSKTALVKVAFQGHTRSTRISCQHRECNCRASPNNVCVSQTVGWINHSIWKWNQTIVKGTLIRYRLRNREPKWIRTILDIYINELHIFLPLFIWHDLEYIHIMSYTA